MIATPVMQRPRRLALALLAALTAGAASAGAASAREYAAPDGIAAAVVSEQGGDDCEAVIVFRQSATEALRISYVSADHQHGSCVDTARWTPDSRFFVFSLLSSGGHSPWHTPIMVYARALRRVVALEAFLADPVTDAKFSVAPPDLVTFTTSKLPFGDTPPVRRSLHLGTLDLNRP